jgi:hypothetical protein
MAILRKPRRIWNDFKAEKKSCESCVKKHFLHSPPSPSAIANKERELTLKRRIYK